MASWNNGKRVLLGELTVTVTGQTKWDGHSGLFTVTATLIKLEARALWTFHSDRNPYKIRGTGTLELSQ